MKSEKVYLKKKQYTVKKSIFLKLQHHLKL